MYKSVIRMALYIDYYFIKKMFLLLVYKVVSRQHSRASPDTGMHTLLTNKLDSSYMSLLQSSKLVLQVVKQKEILRPL